MAKNRATAVRLPRKLAPAARPRSSARPPTSSIVKQQGESFQLKPWDWNRYAEQVRKAAYDLDEMQSKPYFELNSVLKDGVFYAANQLYGMTFKERKDLPVYQPGRARLRGARRGRQAARPVLLRLLQARQQERRRLDEQLRRPVEAARHQAGHLQRRQLHQARAGQPALLSFDDVTTMFHEFGHALHGLFADADLPDPVRHQRGARLRRVPVAVQRALGARSEGARALRDALQDRRSRCPQALVDKIKNAPQRSTRATTMGELIAAAELDMQWHTLPADAPLQDVDAFESEALKKNGTRPRRRAAALPLQLLPAHLGQRLCGRLLRLPVDADARRRRLRWFTEPRRADPRQRPALPRHGPVARQHAQDYDEMFRAFRGHDPTMNPYLQYYGLTGGTDGSAK